MVDEQDIEIEEEGEYSDEESGSGYTEEDGYDGVDEK